MEPVQSIHMLRLKRIESDAAANRISPLETFNRAIELLTAMQQVRVEEVKELHQYYKESAQDLKQAVQMLQDTVEGYKQQAAEIKQLHKFLQQVGMKEEYERRQYKRQMSAVYRRTRKGKTQ